MANLRGSEVLILLLVVVLLFGSKRLPDAARSIGRSMRIFKAETQGLVESEVVPAEMPAVTPAAQQATAPQTPDAHTAPDPQPAVQAQPPSQA
jgi:sec-independent protein translocase protein TatA